ncbi:hypothetical protein LPW11_02600 [Geomonas sp. RF6]|uniref:hypothetical protein n=1 Tax=Geomonas sp. RF6 TaxID=2897342 RepID=UPI001E3CCC70|nr:hypothetical protein [Geomonas sp. RF6]UFS71088.1 hypothetical protein LPW11_02600 [Geomonas sp. RF6]
MERRTQAVQKEEPQERGESGAALDVVVHGRWIRIAEVRDDVWLPGQAVEDPESAIEKLKEGKPRADIFTFVQKLPETKPKYGYPMQWDNVAAIPVTTYQEWWEKRLPQVARKNVKRAAKRGVVARVAQYDDELVRGIVEIHNDTPTRQGRPFSHYGKDFQAVKDDYGSYPERSEFIGSYLEKELIGIIKLIYLGSETASIMQLVAKTAHYDKRPTSALIAKAVEVCAQKGVPYLTYGKYTYGNKTQNTLTEFKARNGFEKIDLPRYYIPLTARGVIAMKLKLHLTLIEVLPGPVINLLRAVRSAYVKVKASAAPPPSQGAGLEEE